MSDTTELPAQGQTTNNQPRTTDYCRFLRSKEMYMHMDQPGWTVADSHSGIFWCLHTQNCLGPDGQVAEPAACQPGRGCHQAW